MSVPTPGESEILETLESVQTTGIAYCRLCDEPVDVSDAEGWGDVFDRLAEHGEEREDHIWDDVDGWRLEE